MLVAIALANKMARGCRIEVGCPLEQSPRFNLTVCSHLVEGMHAESDALPKLLRSIFAG